MGAVIRENGVDLIRQSGDERAQEIGCDASCCLWRELGESELGSSVDGDEEVELAFGGSHFGEIDMKVADRIRFEFAFFWFVAFDLRQSGDAMALQAAVERRPGQLRNGWLESVEAVIEWQKSALAKGDDNGFLFKRKSR